MKLHNNLRQPKKHGILFVIKYEQCWQLEILSVSGGGSDAVQRNGSQPCVAQELHSNDLQAV
jgi:hypothetical protein